MLLHLVIVLAAATFGFLFGQRHQRNLTAALALGAGATSTTRGMRRMLSFSIIVLFFSLTVILSSIAIETALRLGSNEWQYQYVKKVFGEAQTSLFNSNANLAGVLTNTIAYDRPTLSNSTAQFEVPSQYSVRNNQ